jgi:predicted transcriptional regulator
MKRIEELLFQEKPVAALLVLKETGGAYQTLVAKRTDTTYAHMVRIVAELERARLVKSEQAGRVKHLKLTDLGLELAKSLERIREIIALCELAGRVEGLYEKEVRGKLRPEIRRDRVQREADKLRQQLKRHLDADPGLALVAKRLERRLDEILEEALGLPPSPPI